MVYVRKIEPDAGLRSSPVHLMLPVAREDVYAVFSTDISFC